MSTQEQRALRKIQASDEAAAEIALAILPGTLFAGAREQICAEITRILDRRVQLWDAEVVAQAEEVARDASFDSSLENEGMPEFSPVYLQESEEESSPANMISFTAMPDGSIALYFRFRNFSASRDAKLSAKQVQRIALASVQACPAPDGGKRVEVISRLHRHAIMRGMLADDRPPWRGWSRVIPENGYVDLPPAYEVREI
jgi:hypothetical protein